LVLRFAEGSSRIGIVDSILVVEWARGFKIGSGGRGVGRPGSDIRSRSVCGRFRYVWSWSIRSRCGSVRSRAEWSPEVGSMIGQSGPDAHDGEHKLQHVETNILQTNFK
jgi:hypothetical protein